MNLLKALALMAAAGSLGAPVFAEQIRPDQMVAFLDADGDGRCSLQEYLTFQAGRIARFDADANQILSLDEFRSSLQGEAKRSAERSYRAFNIEEARSGLTRREFLGYHAYVFKEFVDADGDGYMTAAEWAKAMGFS